MVNIKFKVFDEHIEEMKNMSKKDFEREFTSIYGNYCMVINDQGYPVLFTDDLIYSDLEFSELIEVHLTSLITVFNNLKLHDLFYIKYIENSFTWLKIKRVNNFLYVSEVNQEYDSQMNRQLIDYVLIEEEVLDRAEVEWGPIEISVTEFEDAVFCASNLLVELISNINIEFLDTIAMRKISEFVNAYK